MNHRVEKHRSDSKGGTSLSNKPRLCSMKVSGLHPQLTEHLGAADI